MSFILALLILINSERVTPLKLDVDLSNRAVVRAEYLCSHKQWSHDGWLDSFKGEPKGVYGENLAINFKDAKSINDALMKSPTHRFNILRPQYKYIGIGQSCGITVELFRS